MGLGDWFITAAKNTAEGLQYVSAAIASPLLKGAEWADDTMGTDLVNENHYIIKDIHGHHEDMVNATTDLISGTVETAETAKELAGKAADWTVDTALPGVGNGFAYIGANILFPFVYTVDQLDNAVLGDNLLPNDHYLVGGVLDDIYRRHDDTVDFTVFTAENPGRTAELAGQGVTNAVTSTVGLVGDVGRLVVWDGLIQNVGGDLIIGNIYNLGIENEEDKWEGHDVTLASAMRWTQGLHDAAQFADPIDPESENATYERVILFGAQAPVEVAAFIATGGATAYVTGTLKGGTKAIGALAKGGQKATTEITEEVVEQTAKAGSKAVAAETAVAETSGKAVETSAKTAASTQNAGQTVGASAQTAGDDIAKTTAEVIDLAKAREAAETLKASKDVPLASASTAQSGNTATVQTGATNVSNTTISETTVHAGASTGGQGTLNAANVAKAGDSVAETTGSLKKFPVSEEMASRLNAAKAVATEETAAAGESAAVAISNKAYIAQQAHATGMDWGKKTMDFFDPRKNGTAGKVIETGGVGLSFGLSYHFSTKEGESLIAKDTDIRASGAEKVATQVGSDWEFDGLTPEMRALMHQHDTKIASKNAPALSFQDAANGTSYSGEEAVTSESASGEGGKLSREYNNRSFVLVLPTNYIPKITVPDDARNDSQFSIPARQ